MPRPPTNFGLELTEETYPYRFGPGPDFQLGAKCNNCFFMGENFVGGTPGQCMIKKRGLDDCYFFEWAVQDNREKSLKECVEDRE